MRNLFQTPAIGILFAALTATTASSQVTLEFKGGTIQDYVKVLRKAIDAQEQYERPNVLVKGPADEVMLPSLTLGSAHPMDALEMLQRFDSDYVGIRVSRMKNSNDANIRPIVVVEIDSRVKKAPKPRSQPAPMTNIISVKDLVEVPLNLRESEDAATLAVPIETLLSAFDVAFSFEEGGAPKIKFHPESGLLFVRGTPTQINVADLVIGRLRTPLENRRSIALGQLASKQRAEAAKKRADAEASATNKTGR